MKIIMFRVILLLSIITCLYSCSKEDDDCEQILVQNNTPFELENIEISSIGPMNGCNNSKLNKLKIGESKKASISPYSAISAFKIYATVDGLTLVGRFGVIQENTVSIDSLTLKDSTLYVSSFYW